MAKRVNTVTLIRGEVYTFRHPDSTPAKPIDSLRFEYGKPVTVEDPKILSILENIYDNTVDGDGEEYEKPRFKVERNVLEQSSETKRGPTRLSADRAVRKRPVRRA